MFGGVSGRGDDIGKFLWMLRIAASVYPKIDEKDYTLNGYRINKEISPKMSESLIYRLSYNNLWNIHTMPGKDAGYDRSRKEYIGF